jgi:trigger factor
MKSLNIQTERLENHVARLTVAVEGNQWEQAKQKAARQLSQRYRIPGFRKGKAPYNVVLRFIGEPSIVEAAIESLGNEIYKDVLKEADINPYTSGAIENFELEPQPTYTFTVPLQPEVELGDYRTVRVAFKAAEVTDDQVNDAMQELRQQNAVVEDSTQPVAAGNRITIDIHSEFADDAPEAAVAEEEESDTEDDEEDKENAIPQKGDNFAHRHDAVINLDPEREPLLPGFINAMVGANVDEEREFELTVPEDDENYKNIGGRKVQFHITVKKVQVVTLPELNDDFAARVTKDEDEPQTLLQLRVKLREDLQKEANRIAENAYANEVLDAIVIQATAHFPEAMLSDRIHEMIDNFDAQLQRQGINLETYQKVMGITHEQLHEQYHDEAVASLNRSLVLGELLVKEDVTLKDADIDAEIEKTLAQFGEQAEAFRKFLDTPQQRSSIANNLLYDRIMTRLAKIGKGESLDEVEDVQPEASNAQETIAEAVVTEESASDATDTDNVEESE